MTRNQKIKEYGIDIVLSDEQYWLDKGYKIDYINDKLIKL